MTKEFIATIEVSIKVDEERCENLDDARRIAVLKGQYFTNLLSSAKLIQVEVKADHEKRDLMECPYCHRMVKKSFMVSSMCMECFLD